MGSIMGMGKGTEEAGIREEEGGGGGGGGDEEEMH